MTSVLELSDDDLLSRIQEMQQQNPPMQSELAPNPMGELQEPEQQPEEIGLDGLSDRKLLEYLGIEDKRPRGLIPELIKSTPDIAKEGLRQHARVMARGIESSVGLPGDTIDFFTNGAIDVFEGLFGYSPKFRQFMVGEKTPMVGSKLPTSEDIRDTIKMGTGETLEPRNAFESRMDSILGDLGALLTPIPGPKAIKGKTPLKGISPARALGTTIGANLVAEGMNQLDFGEGSQAAGKIGTMFALSLMNRKGARQYAGELLNAAEESLSADAMVSAKKLVIENNKLLKQMEKGLPLANKEAIRKNILAIESKVTGGKINAKELTQINRDLNELIYELAGGPEELKRARTALLPLKKNIQESIKEVGKENPEFYKLWKDGNRAWAGVQASNRISDFISRQGLDLGKLDPKTKAIVLASSGITGKAINVATTQVARGAEVLHQVMGDPVLRKFYMNMVQDGLKENATGYIKNLHRLDAELKKINELKRIERERYLKSGKVNLA